MHKLGEVDPQQVAIGMEVEAVWKPEAEREGSILDIRYFRPRETALRRGSRRGSGKKTSRKKASARKRTR